MSSTAETDVYRVAVQFENGRMDFVLPAELSVTAVIPSIVDHLAPRSGWQELPTDWQSAHIDGRLLTSRKSLRDNGVRDGDLLRLSRVRPAVAVPPADDAIAVLSSSLDGSPRWTPTATRVAVSIGTLCCAALVAYALLQSTSSAAPVTAGVLAAVALGAAVAVGRVYREMPAAVALGSSASVWSAVAAYLLVPGDATAPKLMLATAASATISLVATHFIGCGTAVFSGLSSFGLLAAATTCVHVVAPVRVATTGVLLAAAAVALLVLTARLAIRAARVPAPGLRESPAVESYANHAHHAHAIATGLVCGFSAAAMLGSILVTRGGGYGGAAFAAVLGVTLVLRTCTHVDLIQVMALLISGAMCFASVLAWAVGTWRQHAHWIALVATGIVAVSTTWSTRSASPLTRRCVELVEYAALTSLIPLAAWVCGAFAAVGGLHLS